MPNRTCVLTQSRQLSISEAKDAFSTAIDLSDVHNAVSCLKTLLARPSRPEEDDDKTCYGIASISRLITESLVRREDAATDALKALFEVIEREEAQ